MTDGQRAAFDFIDLAWIAWAILWTGLARRTKRAVKHETAVSRALHLVPLALSALLLFDGRFWPRFMTAPVLARGAWMAYAGAALVALGLAFCVWARLILAGNWSGTVTVKESHELVRKGPYELVRHPIYTGLLVAFLGTAVAVDAWRGVLALVIVWLSFWRKSRTEETFMVGTFGAEYEAYRRETPALLPRRLWPRT